MNTPLLEMLLHCCHITRRSGIWNFRFNQPFELVQALLPTQVTHVGWDDLWDTALFDLELGARRYGI
jgi:hypothetical protein